MQKNAKAITATIAEIRCGLLDAGFHPDSVDGILHDLITTDQIAYTTPPPEIPNYTINISTDPSTGTGGQVIGNAIERALGKHVGGQGGASA